VTFDTVAALSYSVAISLNGTHLAGSPFIVPVASAGQSTNALPSARRYPRKAAPRSMPSETPDGIGELAPSVG
jgi:hypothetical protein